MDQGHKQTDKMLKTLERKLSKTYYNAGMDAQKKMRDYLNRFEDADKEMLEKLKKNLITKTEYGIWRNNHMLIGQRWTDLRNTLAEDFSNSNRIASQIINHHTVDVYALNRNYGAYEVSKGAGLNLSFTLYDHKTVERLMRRNPEIIPRARIDIPKDLRWNRVKITSAVTRGILTGDSIPDIAQKLREVANMNLSASIRNARTYTTAAENGGRIDSYKEAEEMGIEMQQEWMATVDSRTRESHIDLDGEVIDVGEVFSNGCRYPGDPLGDPEEIYNCRCTLVAVVKDFDRDLSGRFERLPVGETYDDWKSGKVRSK